MARHKWTKEQRAAASKRGKAQAAARKRLDRMEHTRVPAPALEGAGDDFNALAELIVAVWRKL